MANTTFVLKEPNCRNETLIYLLFRWYGNKLKFSTGQKILPKLWNPEKQRVKEVRTFRQAESLNFLLDQLEETASNQYRKLLLEGITPTPEALRMALNQSLKKEDPLSKDLAHFGLKVLEASSKKDSTKKAIKQTLRLLNTYRDKTGKSLHFDSIDLEFYDRFISLLISQGYAQNSIGSHIKNIKAIMREAFERGLTKNVMFQSKRFKKPEEESQNIYLTKEELENLMEIDLSAVPRLKSVRDLFIVGCNTGLRFSDFANLSLENFNQAKRFIRIRTQKTDEVVIIPINPLVDQIVQKYKGQLPKISNQKMNDYLKELGQLAGIREAVLITSTKGGKQQTHVHEKWQLITTHTARRSFATNAYLNEVPTLSIMKITGHKTEKSFLNYIKISQEDNANKLINHPFFN